MLMIVIVAAMLAGCSYRAWYEGFQQSAQRECFESREECPEPVSYDQYKRERDRELDD